MKRSDLKRIIKEEVQKVLKEYTDNNFSGREEIADTAKYKPDMFGQQVFDEFFPMGAKSESAAIRALKNYDMISQRSPMFVHVQYHDFEDTSGMKYRVHQSQYYNSNFKDQDPNFNPRVTSLVLTKKADPDNPSPQSKKDQEIGRMLVKTDEYIKDLKDLERQGLLGKKVS